MPSEIDQTFYLSANADGFGYGFAYPLLPGESVSWVSLNGGDPVYYEPGITLTGPYLSWYMEAPDGVYGSVVDVTPANGSQAVIDAVEANKAAGATTSLSETLSYEVDNSGYSVIDSITVEMSDLTFSYSGDTLNPALTAVPGVLQSLGGLAVHEGVASWQTSDADDMLTVAVGLYGAGGTPINGSFSFDPASVGPGGQTGESYSIDPSGTAITFTGTVAQIDADMEGLSYVAGTGAVNEDVVYMNASDPSQFFGAAVDNVESAECFCPGTLIRTPLGDMPVEALAIGDHVMTLHGGAQPIRWIGHRRYARHFIADNPLMLPVCIQPGAIADQVPTRELWVSAGHGLHIDGRLVPAWRLVNGRTILQPRDGGDVIYLHVELATHEILFAEDCEAETYLDHGSRAQFANAAEYAALYPTPAAPMPAGVERLEHGFHLEAIRQRLARRAGLAPKPRHTGALRGYIDATAGQITGWAQDLANPETPVSLEIRVDGVPVRRVLANMYRADLRRARIGSGLHAFSCPLNLPGTITIHRTEDHAPLAHATMAGAGAGAA